jgi:hypothetical protein
MHVRQPTANPYILKRLNTQVSFAGSGEQIMYLPTGGAGGKIKRLWLSEQAQGTITGVQIRVGNSVAYESDRDQIEQSQQENGLAPQAGLVVVDFVEDGNLSGVLDTANAANIELRIYSSAPNTYQAFYDFIDPIGRL